MRFKLVDLLFQEAILLLPLAIHCEARLPWCFFVEILPTAFLELAEFPQADALIEEFYIILLQSAVGVSQILVTEGVIAVPFARDDGRWVIVVHRLRGLLQLFQDVDLRGHLLGTPVGLPPRLYHGFLVEEHGAQLIAGLVLHLVEVAQPVEQLLEVFLPALGGVPRKRRRLAISVKVLHFEYNNMSNWKPDN